MDKEVKKFFKTISNDGKINFRFLDEQVREENYPYDGKVKYYSEKSIAEFNEWNEKGYGIYFLPNNGGYKKEQINEFRSCFVDIDIKDEIEFNLINEGYKRSTDKEKEIFKNKRDEIFYSLNEAGRDRYKQIFLSRVNEIREYGIIPSAVIETKNGYHIYYFLHSGATKEEFEMLEGFLIYCFNSDTAVKNTNRLLRVPDTLHMKNPDDPYLIKLIEFNHNIKYETGFLMEKFNQLKADLNRENTTLFLNDNKHYVMNPKESKKQKHTRSTETYKFYYPDGNIELIKKGFEGLEELKIRLGLNYQSDICLVDRKDITSMLIHQDLREFLGVDNSGKFLCMFHKDTTPNGTINVYDNGGNFFKCYSSKCGLHYHIINIVEKLTGLPRYKAYDYLKSLYGIEQIKTDWQKDMEKMIESNIEVFESFEYDMCLRDNFPYITKLMKTKDVINQAKQLFLSAKHKLPSIAKLENKDGVVLFAPMSMILEQLIDVEGISIKAKISKISSANRKMNMLILFYLIGVVGLDELPDSMKQKALESKKHEKGEYKYAARYYEILPIDLDRLEQAESMAKYYYENGGSIKSFSREQTLSLYGEEEANRVFPNRAEEWIPELNKKFYVAYMDLAERLIEEKGWTTKQEMINLVVVPDFDPKQEFRESWKYVKRKVTELDEVRIDDDDTNYLTWLTNYKMKKLETYLPSIIEKNGLKFQKLNLKLKNELNIESIHSNPVIYFDDSRKVIIPEKVKVTVDESQIDEILSLKQDNPKMTVRDIALVVGCSKSYVSKCLKGNPKNITRIK